MADIDRRKFLAGAGSVAAAIAADPGRLHAQNLPNLKGKSFLITGTSSGFGYLGALHYARLGAKVFATMRNLPRPEADKLSAVAAAENLDLHILQLDVLSDDQVLEAVREAERLNGSAIDVLVNNAGISVVAPVEVQDIDATRLIFDTNVTGYQRTARAVLPGMRQRKSGLIVNVSSQAGRIVIPGIGLYTASKFAVEGMSEQLAYDLAPHGIEVTIVQPGGYPTEIAANGARYRKELLDRADERHVSGYPDFVASVENPTSTSSFGRADPMDVPRSIAEIAALPAGQRPLRRPVSTDAAPQEAINRVCAATQHSMFGTPL